ncbi:MAG: hypothetical protein ACI9MC_002415 [Kiritimatiellia bacterium]|jgi:hypothetical protein
MTPVPRLALSLLALLAVSIAVPAWWCGRRANQLCVDDPAALLPLARQVAHDVRTGGMRAHTGDARFDGEWRTVTCMASVIGLVQVTQLYPDQSEVFRKPVETCLDTLDTTDARRFAVDAWGVDGADDLHHAGGHAWLAYHALALGVHRQRWPESSYADRHDEIVASLLRRMMHGDAPLHHVQTYPGEVYPADLAVLTAAVDLHGTLTGQDYTLQRWYHRLRTDAVDPRSGLLYGSLSAQTGEPIEPPRGSSTALATFVLPYGGPNGAALANNLWTSLREHLYREAGGFGAVREFTPGHGGAPNVDSGPVILGLGISATGFAIGGARQAHDRRSFIALHRTAWLFGAPAEHDTRQDWRAAGALGNALMLAMTTTRQPR